jgi:hypothetical protein
MPWHFESTADFSAAYGYQAEAVITTGRLPSFEIAMRTGRALRAFRSQMHSTPFAYFACDQAALYEKTGLSLLRGKRTWLFPWQLTIPALYSVPV